MPRAEMHAGGAPHVLPPTLPAMNRLRRSTGKRGLGWEKCDGRALWDLREIGASRVTYWGALVAEMGWGYNRLPGALPPPFASSPPTSLDLKVIISFFIDRALFIIIIIAVS